MKVFGVDPLILRCWIALPANIILLLPVTLVNSIVQYFLNGVFLLSINQLRGWLTALFSICIGFMMWDQSIHMEHIVHFERWRKFDAVCDRG